MSSTIFYTLNSSSIGGGVVFANLATTSQEDERKQIHEFYGYLLLSQFKTLESVQSLESQCGQKFQCTDQNVEFLRNKCAQLESTINNLASCLNNLNIKCDKLSVPFGQPVTQTFSTSFNIFTNPVSREEDTKGNEASLAKSDSMKPSICVLCKMHKQGKPVERKTEATMIEDNGENAQEEKNPINCGVCCAEKAKANLKNDHDYTVVKLDDMSISEENKELQRLFNKRVKYEVNRKFGRDFLMHHQVRELDVKEMHKIKKRVLRIFAPLPVSIKVAWSNAMNSLRQDRHQLQKKIKRE